MFTPEFERLRRRIRDLGGDGQVELGELFNPSFMQRQTDFADIQEVFDASSFPAANLEDI